MYRIFHGTLYVLVSSMCPLKCKYCVLPFSLCHIYIFICILRLLYSQASVEFCCSKIGMSKRLRQKNIRSTHFPWGFFGGINYVQSHYCFLANGIVTPNVDVVKERKTIQRPSVSCGRTNGGKTPNTSEMSKRAESGRRWKWYTGMRFVFRKILNYIWMSNKNNCSVQRVNDIAQFIKVFYVVFINSVREKKCRIIFG